MQIWLVASVACSVVCPFGHLETSGLFFENDDDPMGTSCATDFVFVCNNTDCLSAVAPKTEHKPEELNSCAWSLEPSLN